MAHRHAQSFIAVAGLSATSLFAAQPPNPSSVLTDGFYDTAMGVGALFSNVTPNQKCVSIATGTSGFFMSGCGNTATGFFALYRNLTGAANTATGAGALYANTSGQYNSAAGVNASLRNTTGFYNASFGANALFHNTTGDSNVANGYQALFANTSGSNNTALGNSAGSALTTGNDNIDIANTGVADESATIRIGTVGTQTRMFVAGLGTNLTGDASALPVVVDSVTGQLGTGAMPTGPTDPAVITLLARHDFGALLKDCSSSPGVPGNGASGNYTYCNFSAVSSMVVNWSSLDLTHSDLSGVDLTNNGFGENFQTVNFSFAKLTNARFDHGNLQNVNFSFADLTGATFVGANKGVSFLYTICPNGSNSGPAGGSCTL